MKYYLFAKTIPNYSLEELMAFCIEAGLDGPTALVRDGYWIRPQSLAEDVPRFVKAANAKGLSVEYASSGFGMAELAQDETPLRILADNGITMARMGYIGRKWAGPPRELFDTTRRLVEGAAKAAEKAGVRAVLQIHGNCYPHNSTAAWFLVKDLDPRWIGIKIDPGNNSSKEGVELWNYQIPLLQDYIAAVGSKDACSLREGDPNAPDKGWRKVFVPVYEGENNWEEIYGELKKVNFQGPMILMPFYDEDDPQKQLPQLKREVEYLRAIEKRIMEPVS